MHIFPSPTCISSRRCTLYNCLTKLKSQNLSVILLKANLLFFLLLYVNSLRYHVSTALCLRRINIQHSANCLPKIKPFWPSFHISCGPKWTLRFKELYWSQGKFAYAGYSSVLACWPWLYMQPHTVNVIWINNRLCCPLMQKCYFFYGLLYWLLLLVLEFNHLYRKEVNNYWNTFILKITLNDQIMWWKRWGIITIKYVCHIIGIANLK